LSTALLALRWMKRVSSSGAIEKPCQLMIAPGVLVIESVLPELTMLACPETTDGPVGLADALPPNAHRMASVSSESR
jgi:hypothetical protein